jgi:hypothetical protein
MDKFRSTLVLHLSRPTVGNDVPRLVRDLGALDGVRRVAAMSMPPRLLVVEHDCNVIAAHALVARVRRGWRPVPVLRIARRAG